MSYHDQEDVLSSDDEGYDPENDFTLTSQSEDKPVPTGPKSNTTTSSNTSTNVNHPSSPQVPSGLPSKNGAGVDSVLSSTPRGPRGQVDSPLPPQSRQYYGSRPQSREKFSERSQNDSSLLKNDEGQQIKKEVRQDSPVKVSEEIKQEVKEEEEEEEEEESDYDMGEVSDYVDANANGEGSGSGDEEAPSFTEAEKIESQKKLDQQNEVKQKIPKGINLFLEYEDKTSESLTKFTNMTKCTYSNKSLGDSKQSDVFSCDCSEELSDDGINSACIDDDCINRGTKIECINGTSTCGDDCANQRFQKRQYANIAVIQTEKKGYGVRSEEELEPDTFVYEYIGEVIDEPTFKKRMIEYDTLNFKHFYFMMLQKGEFIDATRKGSLGRFCNHSCNPNCYVEKWVVGDKLRMGIFTKRKILKGEELTFNYNVDRYGADAQKCYCGEPNCIGFIGGKTQTESASLLPHAISEALGSSIDDEQAFIKLKQDNEEALVKNDNNVNVEFVKSLEMKSIQIHEANSVMGVLLQCDDSLIADRLIERLELTDSYNMKMKLSLSHGYTSLGKLLKTFNEDEDNGEGEDQTKFKIEEPLILRILKVLESWPPVSKNTIIKSEIIPIVTTLIKNTSNSKIIKLSKELLERWDNYEERKSFKRSNPLSTNSRIFDDRRRPKETNTIESPNRTQPQSVHGVHSGHNGYDNGYSYNNNINVRVNKNNFGQFSESERLEREKYRIRKEKEEKERIQRERELAKIRERSQQQNDVLKAIEMATQMEQDRKRKQVELLKFEEDKKKKKEAYRQKQIERKKKRALESLNTTASPSIEPTSTPSSSTTTTATTTTNTTTKPSSFVINQWKVFFGKHIPNMVSSYSKKELTKEEIKELSKEIVSILISKELKKNDKKHPPDVLEVGKRKKIKEFVSVYVSKSLQKHKKRRLNK